MRSLLQHGLVDQLDCMVSPIVIGEGQRLFGDSSRSLDLQLAGHTDLATGVAILSYRPRAASAT
jgi:dihydrofolate reductase